jgi:hypothetical protein
MLEKDYANNIKNKVVKNFNNRLNPTTINP